MRQESHGRRAVTGVALAVALGLLSWAAGTAKAALPQPFEGKREVSVMTRNLFIGTDLGPVFAARTTTQLVTAVTVAFAEVQATRFPERAQAIAGEIEATEPDLVGLQEAVLIRTDVPADGSDTPAETVAYDYLDILLRALEARGLHYAPVAVATIADNELPALGFDARVTDREVLLARNDLSASELKLSNAQAGKFATNLTLPTLGGPVALFRGWVSVDAKIRGKRFRLVSTHLEPFSAAVQAAQAGELLAGPGDTELPTIFVGDFNSRADGTGTPTYGNLIAAGFQDAWSETHPDDPGLTCCWETHLLSPMPPFDERIDLVLARGGFAAVDAEIVGEELTDRTPSGLFHSDHAGVTATLRLSR